MQYVVIKYVDLGKEIEYLEIHFDQKIILLVNRNLFKGQEEENEVVCC